MIVNPEIDENELTVHGEIPCPLEIMRWELYSVIQDQFDGKEKIELASILRIYTQTILGHGNKNSLKDLWVLTKQNQSIPIISKIFTSLTSEAKLWKAHDVDKVCSYNRCTVSSLPPCREACPAGINLPGFMSELVKGNEQKAIEIILQDNALPLVCGIVCPAPCETNCVRKETNQEAVSLRRIKAEVAYDSLKKGYYPTHAKKIKSNKHIAVIGSGPSSLSAAWYLSRMGHSVSIFEQNKDIGGMLRYGIPEFRLPKKALTQEIKLLKILGVKILVNQPIKNIQHIRDEHDAVYFAVGAQNSRLVPILGVNADFVINAIKYLHDAREDNKTINVGDRVVVIGGGSVAVDAALTAYHQGAKQVELFCLESKNDMPAHPKELEEVEDYHIPINNQWGPLSISEKNNTINFHACVQTHDSDGRFHPVFDDTKVIEKKVDSIILAIGQTTDLSFLSANDHININHNLIAVNPQTLETTIEGVFAGGDAVTGPKLVVNAVADGKKAAYAIDYYLNNKILPKNWSRFQNKTFSTPAPVDPEIRSNRHRLEEKNRDLIFDDNNRSIVKLDVPLLKEAMKESERCLRCDVCIGCGLCELACMEMGVNALKMKKVKSRLSFVDFSSSNEKCIGCGACTQVCPHNAIMMKDVNNRREIVLTGTIISEHKLINCMSCGKPFATEAMLDKLDNTSSKTDIGNALVCSECARKTFVSKYVQNIVV